MTLDCRSVLAIVICPEITFSPLGFAIRRSFLGRWEDSAVGVNPGIDNDDRRHKRSMSSTELWLVRHCSSRSMLFVMYVGGQLL